MVCGIRGNVWGNGAGIWGRPRGCVRTVDMEDAACVWEPSACMGNGNPMMARNMKSGVRSADFVDFWQYQGSGA